MTASSWTEALDEFEARLVLAESVLEHSDDADAPLEVSAFVPPELPGTFPLPSPLASRAQELLARSGGLVERLDTEQRRIRAELVRTPRIAPGRNAGSTLDVHA